MATAPIEPEALSDLIGAIYDCAIDPDRWEATLEAIRLGLNCFSGQLSLNELPSGRFLLVKSTKVPAYWLAQQPALAPHMVELWAPVLNDPMRDLDEPALSSRELTAEHWNTNAANLNWFAPQGIVDVMELFLIREQHRLANFGFSRHASQGHFSEREMRLGRLLAPHLRRAIVISNMLDVATIAAASFEAALDALSAGVFLVDQEARLVHANRAGHAILAESDPIQLVHGALKTGLPAASVALTQAIMLAGQSETALGRAGIGVPAPSRQGRAHVAHVLPLRQGDVRRRWAPGAVAAVFVAPASAEPSIPTEALIALYNLTPAEARVLVAVAAGRTLGEAASALAIAESTVKTHLVRIFAKTGTSRQAELALLVSSLTFPVHISG